MSAPNVWFITTGEAGYRTQARGLARALSEDAREWIVDLRAPWRWLPVALAAPFALGGLDQARDRPVPPWPDLVVTCGRKAAAVSAPRGGWRNHRLSLMSSRMNRAASSALPSANSRPTVWPPTTGN